MRYFPQYKSHNSFKILALGLRLLRILADGKDKEVEKRRQSLFDRGAVEFIMTDLMRNIDSLQALKV